MRHATALLVGLLALLVPETSRAAERTFAIVLGNNEPPAGPVGEGLSKLHYADDDAIRYAELLQQFADDVHLLTVLDGQTRRRYGSLSATGAPTLSSLRRSVQELGDRAQEHRDAGDRVVFYLVLSAHGAIGDDGQAFVSLLDAPLSRKVLFEEILGRIPADRVHLIIDACHAAGVVGLRGRGSFGREVDAQTSPVSEDEARSWVAARTLDRFPHVGVLAATTAGEQAHEWSVIESGVFSHEVLSALWGAGDINGDLEVEYSEVQAFVAAANRRVEDPRAVPTVVARPPPAAPHDPITDLSRFRQSVLFTGEASTLGHFHIERNNGQRHLDANLGASQVTLAVPAGSRSFLRAGEQEIELRGSPGTKVALLELPRRPVEERARGSTAAAYRRALFREPYTPDYYRGYVDSIQAPPVTFRPEPAEPATPSAPPPSPRALPTPSVVPITDEPPRVDRSKRRRGAGIAMAVVAGGTGAASVVTAALAANLRVRFARTDTESTAHELDDRHRPLATTAIVTGMVAVTTTVAAILLLRSARRAR